MENQSSGGAVIGAITCGTDILLTKDFGFRNPKWKCPGGAIEPGESLLAALGRELQEEIGLELNQDIVVTKLDERMLSSEPCRFLHFYQVEVPQWEMGRMNNTVRLGQDTERVLCRKFKLKVVKSMNGFLAQQLPLIQILLKHLGIQAAA